MRISFNELKKIVVAVDPAGGHGEGAADTGIVVVGRGPHQDKTCKLQELTGRCPGHGYVLGDFTCHLAPAGWAKRAITVYDRFEADRIIAEVNYGGEMVGTTVHAVRAGVPFQAVNASRGKHIRAEPIAALFEQGRFHFVVPCPQLEDELTTWTEDAKWSPNRLDAMVWGATALGLIGGQGHAFLQVWRGEIAARKKANPKDESPEAKALRNIIRLAPRHGVRPDSAVGAAADKRIDTTCEHIYRSDICLVCGGSRDDVEAAGVTRRGALRA